MNSTRKYSFWALSVLCLFAKTAPASSLRCAYPLVPNLLYYSQPGERRLEEMQLGFNNRERRTNSLLAKRYKLSLDGSYKIPGHSFEVTLPDHSVMQIIAHGLPYQKGGEQWLDFSVEQSNFLASADPVRQIASMAERAKIAPNVLFRFPYGMLKRQMVEQFRTRLAQMHHVIVPTNQKHFRKAAVFERVQLLKISPEKVHVAYPDGKKRYYAIENILGWNGLEIIEGKNVWEAFFAMGGRGKYVRIVERRFHNDSWESFTASDRYYLIVDKLPESEPGRALLPPETLLRLRKIQSEGSLILLNQHLETNQVGYNPSRDLEGGFAGFSLGAYLDGRLTDDKRSRSVFEFSLASSEYAVLHENLHHDLMPELRRREPYVLVLENHQIIDYEESEILTSFVEESTVGVGECAAMTADLTKRTEILLHENGVPLTQTFSEFVVEERSHIVEDVRQLGLDALAAAQKIKAATEHPHPAVKQAAIKLLRLYKSILKTLPEWNRLPVVKILRSIPDGD